MLQLRMSAQGVAPFIRAADDSTSRSRNLQPNSAPGLCLKSRKSLLIGSVQGAVATWSVIDVHIPKGFWTLMVGPGRYRSLY